MVYMTETILNSLYYQTLFLQNEGSLEKYLQKNEDIFSFVQAIPVLIERTKFFTNKRRALQLRFTLARLTRHKKTFFAKNEELLNKIKTIMDYCDLIESEKNLYIQKDSKEYDYALFEAKRRHISSLVPLTPEKMDSSITFEYSITSSLVNDIQLDSSYKLSQLLNAFGLLITTYQEILYENPRIYFFITTYLTILLEKMNLESFFHKKRIRVILEEYQQLQNYFSNKEEFSFQFIQNKEGS